jgi:hypothetical protein
MLVGALVPFHDTGGDPDSARVTRKRAFQRSARICSPPRRPAVGWNMSIGTILAEPLHIVDGIAQVQTGPVRG